MLGALAGLALGASPGHAAEDALRIAFASVPEAQKVLAAQDGFVRQLSPFDRAARLQVGRAVSEKEFLAFVTGEVMPWDPEEVKRVEAAFQSIRPRLALLKLNFPERVLMIKTTGREEGEAAYTRQAAIILPQGRLRGRLNNLVAHELFHVLSRHDPKWRDSLYALIGFEPCGEVMLPEPYFSRRITNPDAPVIEHALRAKVAGQAERVVPVLHSDAPQYDAGRGGKFFDYLQFRLLVVRPEKDRWVGVSRNGEPWLLKPGEVSGLAEQIGTSDDFLHPEEVLARLFAEIVNAPAESTLPPLQEKLRAFLKK